MTLLTKPVTPAKQAKEKKVSKSKQKTAPKKIIAKKAVKPVKKIIVKKAVPKPVKKIVAAKKVTKPEKKIGKKAVAAVIIEKKIAISKTLKAVKTAKPVKIEKPEKIKKAELPNNLKPVKKSKGGRKPKRKDDDEDEPVIENDILIEQLINSTKRLKKPVKVPRQLRTFTNPMASLAVAKPLDANKKSGAVSKKEPKGKFELEYVMRTSAGILYEFLTSPSGLSEWFADDVNIHEGVFTFIWEGSEQKARLLGFKEEKFVRLQWLDKPDGTYFEFRIERDELTGDVSLIVTDFADEGADLKTSKLLWDSQINKLLHVIGSY